MNFKEFYNILSEAPYEGKESPKEGDLVYIFDKDENPIYGVIKKIENRKALIHFKHGNYRIEVEELEYKITEHKNGKNIQHYHFNMVYGD